MYSTGFGLLLIFFNTGREREREVQHVVHLPSQVCSFLLFAWGKNYRGAATTDCPVLLDLTVCAGAGAAAAVCLSVVVLVVDVVLFADPIRSVGLGGPSGASGKARGAELVAPRTDAHGVDGANPRVSEARP